LVLSNNHTQKKQKQNKKNHGSDFVTYISTVVSRTDTLGRNGTFMIKQWTFSDKNMA